MLFSDVHFPTVDEPPTFTFSNARKRGGEQEPCPVATPCGGTQEKGSPPATAVAGKVERMVRLRVRIRFSKQGDLRLIGHRDLMRCLERLFRRAGLALSFSQGFHPKPRMTFPLALAVGIEGTDEVMEVELAESCTAEDLLRRMAPHAPAGLVFRTIEVLPEGAKKAQVQSASYEAPIPSSSQTGLGQRIEHLLAAASWPIERLRGRAPIDLRPLISELTLRDGVLAMRLRVDSHGSVGPREVLGAIGLADIEQQGVHLCRTAVEVCA
jgi:radical SAM-linked protein